ncbi:uncharacterized protein C10orf62 homolog [Leptopilina heterotoma]|uniref:uncharacterized protein C10orf62 homolog n=1 Tax=Leptopilina heterotoma TaxID=63436 RepID=UPI001CA9261D|nr:uncharacterized protein C10orf62 homolog [Leptopilina heterotoma]
MFKIFVVACLIALSNAHLNHGPTIINPPNYGLYPGGYQVRENGLGIHGDANYLNSHNPGLISAHGRPVIGAIQPLGHTGYAYAPAAKNFALNQAQLVQRANPHAYALQTGQITHLGQVGHLGHLGQVGHLGHLGQVGHLGHVGQVGHLGHLGQVGHLGHVGQVGHLGHLGQVGNVGHLGQLGHLGHGGHAGGNFVVPPSVTFSQNAPQRIAPIGHVSNSVRIPYSYPVINAPHPVSHGDAQQISSPAHGW